MATNDFAVLTAIGEDRPGLVNALSRALLRFGCNIEDSRMALLGDSFAMLLLVRGSARSIASLLDDLADVGHEVGLRIEARHSQTEGSPGRGKARPYLVAACAMDHPGIVERITHLFADRGINIRALDTRIDPAPLTGQPLFSLQARIEVPVDESIPELQRALRAMGAEDDIEVMLSPESETQETKRPPPEHARH